MKNIYFMIAFAALLLAGCGKDDGSYKFENSEPGAKAVFNAAIDRPTETNRTRAVNQEWTIDDCIGITCSDSYSPDYDQKNYPYCTTTAQGNFTAKNSFKEIWLLGANTYQITAYYPYSGTIDIVPDKLAMQTTTEYQTKEKQPQIDFLFASGTASRENPNVDLTFYHRMSRLVIQFVSQTDADGNPLIEDLGIIDCFLMKVKQSGTFNPTTGIAVADITENANNNNIRQTLNGENKHTLSLILFPQTELDAQIDAIMKNAEEPNGIYYKIPLKKLHLEAGHSYNYTAIAKKTADGKLILEISKGTITDWEEVGNVEVESDPGRVQTTVDGTSINGWEEGETEVDVETKDAQ